MSAKTIRLKKEARALFWPWCAVTIVGALPLVHGTRRWNEVVMGLSAIGFLHGVTLLASFSFGSEFQCRTVSLLLSQPAARMEIWREKLMVTLAAVVSAAVVCRYSWPFELLPGPAQWMMPWAAGLYIITAMASATFWTLLARSTLGGYALNMMILPLGVMLVTGWDFWENLGHDRLPTATIRILSVAALGYAGVMLWLGARKLARFQVTGGMAGDDLLLAGPNVMPEALAGWFRSRPTEPFFNLIRKELRLLRTVWLMALLLVLYLACLAAFRLLPDLTQPPREVQLALAIPFSFSPVMALLAGCLSLGEERTSGTHSWHMTLPVSARRQWLVKLLVSLFAGFVCAALLPILVFLAGGSLFGSLEGMDWGFAVFWMLVVPVASLVSFWCACAVNGSVRAAIWILPATLLVSLAGESGDLIGRLLAKITGTPRDFVVSWLQLSPLAFTNIPFTNLALLPVLLLALVQSYRLFRTQPQDGILWMIRSLLPLALAAFLCGFSVSAGWAGTRWQPFSEAEEAMEKLHTGGTTAQLTMEDLAQVSPLSELTRRWLRDARISVAPDPARSGYFATIHLPGGLDCGLAVAHNAGRSFHPAEPSCARKGP